jgi:GT2 family glycosyltransferase
MTNKFNHTYIVIVTFNGMAWLDKCLLSCKGYPVIIIDNASTDATVPHILKNYPNIELIQQAKNLGFGAANNIGIKHALNQGAAYVFLLNQDAYLQPDTIKKLVNTHQEHKEYGVLSPIHLNGDGAKLDKLFSYRLKQNNDLMSDLLCSNKLKKIYDISFVNAAAWLLPKQVLETVGGFDPLFFHYGEDDNYCQRVLYHGFKIGVHPNAFVYHDREQRAAAVQLNFEEELEYKERQLKKIWANLNLDNSLEIKNKILENKKLILKLFLKLKFKKVKYHWFELQMMKKIEVEIKISKKVNKTKGCNYL